MLEQKSIICYLDHKTALIDRITSNRRKQIELLKEERKAVINKTVTKGINKNAKMKPSGIDYIKEIPFHWQVVKLKRIANIDYGTTLQLEKGRTDGVDLISVSNITIDGRFNFDNKLVIPHELVDNRNILKKGDLLFNWRNGSNTHIGKTAYFDLDGKFTHVSFLLRIRIKGDYLYSKYLQAFLMSLKDTGFFQTSKDQVNRTFNSSELGELEVLIPPLQEQKEIVDFYDAGTNFDLIITKYENQISLLEEYRTALISKAVTGQIDVREWQPEAELEEYLTH